jgi:cytochrome P450
LRNISSLPADNGRKPMRKDALMDAAQFDVDMLSSIDHHAPYFLEHNYEIYEKLRQRCPMPHSSAWGGFYLALDYDTAYEVAQDTETFSSAPGRTIPSVGVPPDGFPPLDSDPPLHGHYRKITLPWLSPAAAKREEQSLRGIATELIDDFIETGEADIVGQLTTPLPAIWILRLLGFEEDRWPAWVQWIHAVVHERSSDPDGAMAAAANIHANIVAEVDRRRSEGYRDDLLSILMKGRVEGEPLPDTLVLNYAFGLILGGMDTTSGLTGNAFVQLDKQPQLRQRLIHQPETLGRATEEFLRHDTPAQTHGRTVTKDCVYKGQQLHSGDHVLLSYAAANRDPAVFKDPDRIDFDREANRHMAFGIGIHRCIGANHARVMFQVMVSEVLRRLPDYAIDGDVVRFPDAGDIFAVRRLPIRFSPGKRSKIPSAAKA